MPHWSQTPEGRKKLADAMRRRLAGPAGKKHRAKMKAGHRRYVRSKAAAVVHVNGIPKQTAYNRKYRESGRQMLVELARTGAAVRRAALVRELEKLDLFIAKTSGGQK